MSATFIVPEEVIREEAARDGVTHFVTGIAIIRDGKVLVVRRVANDFLGGFYELPGGGVDPGEAFAEGAIRETFEETGLKVSAIVGMFASFDYATKTKPKVRQINFIVEVEPGVVTLEPTEHDALLWIGPEDIAGLHTTDEMRTCLRAIFAR
ncbi:MAG TPA: NUDIX hydrolase [Candidatus Saccharimonadales bacterium]